MKKSESDLQYNQTTFNEEDWLSNDFNYSAFLDDEKEIKMDLSFEDFLDKVGQKGEEKKSGKKINFYKLVSGIAACSLFGLGIFYSLNHSENQVSSKIIINHTLAKEYPTENFKISDEVVVVVENEVPNKKLNEVISKKEVTRQVKELEQPILEEENIELVTVNGEVVEDTERAEEIALDALKLLATNLSKGGEAVNNLKHLSIQL